MQFLCRSVFVIALFGLVAAGYHHHGHEATSYSVHTKHDVVPYHGKHAVSSDHGHTSHGFGGHVEQDHGHHAKHEPHHHPKYEFAYGVKDAHTGDHKDQWEHRDGGHVKGGYSLKEADGTTRVVEYTADDHNGFKAIVKKIGHAHHPQDHHKGGHHDGGYGYKQTHDSYGHGHGHGHGHATSYVHVSHH